MSKVSLALQRLNESPPHYLKSATLDGALLRFEMDLPLCGGEPAGPRVVVVRLSDEYVANPPCGSASFCIGAHLHTVPASDACTVRDLAARVHSVALSLAAAEGAAAQTMVATATSESPRWSAEPTADLMTPPTGLGGFHAGMAPEILDAVAAAGDEVLGARFTDMPALGRVVVAFSIPVRMSERAASSWRHTPGTPLSVQVTLDRARGVEAPMHVVVGPATSLSLASKMQLVLQRACDALTARAAAAAATGAAGGGLDAVTVDLLLEGFDRGEAAGAVRGGAKTLAAARKALIASGAATEDTKAVRQLLLEPRTRGFVHALGELAARRLPTLADYCVLCDCPHTMSTGMLRATVCTRPLCAFRFQELSVGAAMADTLAIQTGVVDLLVTFTRLAAMSSRWQLILDPFPNVVGPDGAPAFAQADLNARIEAVRGTLKKIPETGALIDGGLTAALAGAHPLALPLFNWIFESNRSLLVKLPPEDTLAFMGTPHQFILAQASDERCQRFAELKRQHGAVFAFHGSGAENWHSILRNGLRVASGTPLMVNGQAHGTGIYISPAASTSLHYSRMHLGEKPEARAGEYLDPTSTTCMCVVEVINKDIKKSGDVWVSPKAEYVITRFFFAFTRGSSMSNSVHLEKKDLVDRLNAVLERHAKQ